MIERITKNEERLDCILSSIDKLNEALDEFKSNKKNIQLINKYYGSNNWFKDKEMYEKNLIPKVKAGVLSEDTVWNTFEDINELLEEMKLIINEYKKIGDE